MSLRGHPYITSSNSTLPRLFTTSRPSRRFTPARTALSPASTELERPLKDSRGPVAERAENSPEIPETPTVALESMRRGDDDHSDDGNSLSHFRGHWSTETDGS
jgi:hypothetical protein